MLRRVRRDRKALMEVSAKGSALDFGPAPRHCAHQHKSFQPPLTQHQDAGKCNRPNEVDDCACALQHALEALCPPDVYALRWRLDNLSSKVLELGMSFGRIPAGEQDLVRGGGANELPGEVAREEPSA